MKKKHFFIMFIKVAIGCLCFGLFAQQFNSEVSKYNEGSTTMGFRFQKNAKLRLPVLTFCPDNAYSSTGLHFTN
jgi:hypothetical protein